MIVCDKCGKDINEENQACPIHPEEGDNAIKAQLIARDLRIRTAQLVIERREHERRV